MFDIGLNTIFWVYYESYTSHIFPLIFYTDTHTHTHNYKATSWVYNTRDFEIPKTKVSEMAASSTD